MPQTLISFMGSIEYPVFSDYLGQLQECDDADEAHELLMRAYSAEPYLLAKLVSLANSVVYGFPGSHFYTPEECLSRVGMVQGTRLALSFFVEAGLRGWLQKDQRSRAVWQEAVFASQIAQLMSSASGGVPQQNGSFLATLLSYLGELFLAGPVFDKLGDNVHLGLYAKGQSGEIDPYVLTKILMRKLSLPKPVESSLMMVERLYANKTEDGHRMSAATLTMARGLAQRFYSPDAFVAYVGDDTVHRAQKYLGLADVELETLLDKAKVIRQDLTLYLS